MMSSGTTLDRLPLPHAVKPKGLFYASGGQMLPILKGPPQTSKRLMDPTCPTCPMRSAMASKKRGGKLKC